MREEKENASAVYNVEKVYLCSSLNRTEIVMKTTSKQKKNCTKPEIKNGKNK